MLVQAFVQSILSKHFRCAKHSSRFGHAVVNKSDGIPALGELPFSWGCGGATLGGGVGGCLELKEGGPVL